MGRRRGDPALRVLDDRSRSGRAYAPELRRGRAGLTARLGDLYQGQHTLEYTGRRAPPARLSDSAGLRAVDGPAARDGPEV